MLMPKKVKFRKQHRGRRSGPSKAGEYIAFGDFALQALEPLAAENDVALADELPALPVVSADPDRIRQVLFNLLVNALRHTPQGGRVTVGGAAIDDTVTIWVADTGEGLDAGELAAIFDRFYRADRSRSRQTGGSGLGLAIVKAIVEAHGGRAMAESAGKGQGSRFIVSLPAVDA